MQAFLLLFGLLFHPGASVRLKLKGGWGNPKILRPAKNRGEENFRGGKTYGWLFPSLARWGGAAMVKFLWVGVVVKVKIFFACGALLLIVPHPIP